MAKKKATGKKAVTTKTEDVSSVSVRTLKQVLAGVEKAILSLDEHQKMIRKCISKMEGEKTATNGERKKPVIDAKVKSKEQRDALKRDQAQVLQDQGRDY